MSYTVKMRSLVKLDSDMKLCYRELKNKQDSKP